MSSKFYTLISKRTISVRYTALNSSSYCRPEVRLKPESLHTLP